MAPETGALVTKFPLTLDSLLTTQETKAALTGTSDEPAPCASGSMRQGAAPSQSVQGLMGSELKAIQGAKPRLLVPALLLSAHCCSSWPLKGSVCMWMLLQEWPNYKAGVIPGSH